MSKENEKIKAAEKAIVAFEAVSLGESWRNDYDAATAAIGELRNHARTPIFPDSVSPAGQDLLADLNSHVEHLGREKFGLAIASLHERCLDLHPRLGELLRGCLMLRRVGDEAAAMCVTLQRPGLELAEEAQELYETEVAGQLHARGELTPSSTIVGVTVPIFENRTNEAREKQQAYTTAEIERVERERREAEAVLAAEEERLRKEVEKAARELEAEAKRKRDAARLERGKRLALRLERLGIQQIELSHGMSMTRHLIDGLRSNQFADSKIDEIERAVENVKRRRRS